MPRKPKKTVKDLHPARAAAPTQADADLEAAHRRVGAAAGAPAPETPSEPPKAATGPARGRRRAAAKPPARPGREGAIAAALDELRAVALAHGTLRRFVNEIEKNRLDSRLRTAADRYARAVIA